jgi:hypothetical protein
VWKANQALESELLGIGITFPNLRLHEDIRGTEMSRDNEMARGKGGASQASSPRPGSLKENKFEKRNKEIYQI